jgi:hypothetical protein
VDFLFLKVQQTMNDVKGANAYKEEVKDLSSISCLQ